MNVEFLHVLWDASVTILAGVDNPIHTPNLLVLKYWSQFTVECVYFKPGTHLVILFTKESDG